MNNIISINSTAHQSSTIMLDRIRESRSLRFSQIAPGDAVAPRELAEDRAATPIKSIDDIQRISDFLMERQHAVRRRYQLRTSSQ